MALRNATPYKFKPRGVTDTWDGMNAIPGAMTKLQNLVPDPGTPSAFICRPAASVISTFSGFSSPGFVPIALQLNNYVYGMVGTARNTGKDEPFCYNVSSGSFVSVSGVLSTNVPTSQSPTGDWTPPVMASVGGYIIVTHPGFNGANGYFGWFDITGYSISTTTNTTSGSTVLTGNPNTTNLSMGMTVTGTGIASGARVTNFSSVSLSLGGTAASGSPTITGIASTAGTAVGQLVTGSGIPVGATIVSFTSTSITLSVNATTSAATIAYVTGATITLSIACTATASNIATTIAGGSVGTPLWCSGNLLTNPLTAVPRVVQLFYNRAYFSVGNVAVFSDTLSLIRTSATQSVTCGDITPVVAMSLFTLSTTTQGILQGLLLFKTNTVFQITGDQALGTLQINSLNTAAGTEAASSVVATPIGVFFMAPDGVRIVQPDGTVTEPDQDLQRPFFNALYPSRVNASYNSDVYRICVQNAATIGDPWEEYWYDIGKEIWSGPHTFQQDVALAWDSGFICFSHINQGLIYKSYTDQVIGCGFLENGAQLQWDFQTAPIGEDDSLFYNNVVETTCNMSFTGGSSAITCTASDENSGHIATGVVYPEGSYSVWGQTIWGQDIWGAAQYGLRPYLIPWSVPIVTSKIVFDAKGYSSLGFKISNVRFVVQPAEYYNLPQGSTTLFKPIANFTWDNWNWDTINTIWS